MPGPNFVGELKMLQYENGTVVDPFAFRIGLPANLTNELRQFCVDMGFPEIIYDLMGPGEYEPGGDDHVRIKGKNWYIQRPAKKWHSNSHWMNPNDLQAHEHLLRVLGDGGFDVALAAIGTHFGLESLTCYSVGFFAVNHCENGWVHDDFNDVGNKTFNVLIPLNLANASASELYVQSRDTPNVTATVHYEYDVAIGVGDDTKHAAGDCDYRDSGGVRFMATIYLAEINEDNVDNIVKHYTDPFPPADSDYLLKWRGLHWNKDGSVHLPRDWRSHTLTDENLLPGPNETGQLSLLQFADGTPVDPYAFRVKFPSKLTKTLRDFCDDMGLPEIFRELMTPEGSYAPGDEKYVKIKGKQWYIQRPAKKWHSNSHWLNPMDEEAQDQFLRILGDGGFDVVLEAIGRHFGLDGLTCYSVGFFVVNHCENGWMHDDFKKVKGRAFNLLLPVQLDEESIAELKVESVDYSKITVKVPYETETAVGVGDYTRHATGNCDYRESGGMRVMVTIYLADIDRDNVKNIIEHYTDPYPPAEEDYLMSRSGIHWSSDGTTRLPSGDPRTEAEQALMDGPSEPAQVAPLQFQDGVAVDPYAFRVGLPASLTKTLKDYCDQMGLTILFRELMGSGALDPDDDEYVEIHGKRWYLQRPGEKFETTSHWLSTADEEAQEQYLQVLGDDGFDTVLDGIGRHFDMDGLYCYSLGFVVLDQCIDSFVYYDYKRISGKAFSLYFPVVLPAKTVKQTQHYVRTRNDANLVAKVDYEYNTALAVGDYTRHAIGDMDFHESDDDIVVLATVYIADINEDNVANLVKQLEEPFPPKKKDYFLKQRGRHWNRDGSAHLPRGYSPPSGNEEAFTYVSKDNAKPTPEEEGDMKLLPGPTEPGELSLLKFANGQIVDPYAFRIGIPKTLTMVLRAYCDTLGLTELFGELMGDDGLDPDDSDEIEIKATTWYVQRPSDKFHTTAHWLNPTEEGAHEEYLRVLAEGGFDVVLEGIGRHYKLDGLTVYSVGFAVLDQCEDGFMYWDFQDVDGKAFSLSIPLMLDYEFRPEHYVGSRADPEVVAEVPYQYSVALGVGDDTKHAEGDIDFEDSGGMLVIATVYVADINEDNVANLIKDFVDPFPPKDEEYFLNQKGIHWNPEGTAQLPRN